MRREHSAQQSYLDWLKSLGCVLWLPFAADGDLNDRISTNNLQPTSDTSGYFAWDNNKDMMYYHSPSSNSVKSHTLQTIWDNTTFANNDFTILSECARKSTTGYAMFFMLGNTYTRPNGAALMYNGSVNMANWGTSQVHKIAYYIGSANRKIYQNGALYNTYAAAAGLLPSAWGSWDYFVGAAAYSIGLSDVLNREIYLRNIMIFNRELTLTEIRQIQGYE